MGCRPGRLPVLALLPGGVRCCRCCVLTGQPRRSREVHHPGHCWTHTRTHTQQCQCHSAPTASISQSSSSCSCRRRAEASPSPKSCWLAGSDSELCQPAAPAWGSLTPIRNSLPRNCGPQGRPEISWCWRRRAKCQAMCQPLLLPAEAGGRGRRRGFSWPRGGRPWWAERCRLREAAFGSALILEISCIRVFTAQTENERPLHPLLCACPSDRGQNGRPSFHAHHPQKVERGRSNRGALARTGWAWVGGQGGEAKGAADAPMEQTGHQVLQLVR